jgi:hypothetical protein
METRERRRWLTLKHCLGDAKFWTDFHRRHSWGWPTDPRFPGLFKKRRKFSCNCRHRCHGNPKVGRGVCAGGFREVVADRIRSKRLCRLWLSDLRGGVHPDDVE